jgi:ElaB/YqjD/DUF883 family membrane-anchored ribosome-binding protein
MVGSNNVDQVVDQVKDSLKQGEQTIKSGESGREIDAGKEAVMSAYNKLMEAKSHFLHAAEVSGVSLKGDAYGQLNKGKAKASELSNQATHFIHEKPMAALGVAFAAGFIVSKLLSSSK